MVNKFENIYSRIYLNSYHPLSSETREFIGQKMKSATYKKGELICRQDELFTKLAIIKKGLVRGYYTLNDQEITTWISIDDDIFTSTNFFNNSPAIEHIEALETTYIEYLEYDDMIEALNSFDDFKVLNRKLLEMYFSFAEKRALISRIPNASDRFIYFLNNYNQEIIKRSPKKHLASFLAIRPETLSRLIRESG